MNDPNLESLLRNARRVAPRPELKGRLRARVLSAAAVGGALASTAAHAGAAAAKVSGATLASANTPVLWSAVYALAAGAAVGGLATLPFALRAPIAVSSAPVSSQAEPRTSAQASHEAIPQLREGNTPPAASASVPSELKPFNAPQRAAPANRTVPSIERETLLLSEAQRALQRGNAQLALAWLDRYGAEFPRGALAEEALAARGVTWCSLGRLDLGERTLRSFERTYPSSPLLSRLKAACRNLGEP